MTYSESTNEYLNDNPSELLDMEMELSHLQAHTNISNLKEWVTDNPQSWNFEYIEDNWNYKIYSYTVKRRDSIHSIKNLAEEQLKLRTQRWINITYTNWNEYSQWGVLIAWQKVHIMIPKTDFTETVDNSIEIVDWMKCKWWEYFWIDVSRFNNGVRRLEWESDKSYKARCEKYWDNCYDDFIERNEKKWNSEWWDVRWVSFIYIRAWDGLSNDVPADKESIKNWTNFIKKYNQEEAIKDNHEQIASWFYWTLTNRKSIQTQADNFLKVYDEYKDIPWWHNLVPMLDLETDRFTEVKTWHKDKKGRVVVDERYTPQQFKENALQWLQYIETKTWVIPGIYVWAKAYGNYIKWDKRFDKYLTRITAYPGSSRKTGREMGTARRINFEEWSVNVWTSSQPIDIKPDMYQSSQEWSVAWASAEVKEKDKKKYMDTDMNHTKDITKLFAENNRLNNTPTTPEPTPTTPEPTPTTPEPTPTTPEPAPTTPEPTPTTPEPTPEFTKKNVSTDCNYMVYSYITPAGSTPDSIKNDAVRKNLTNNKNKDRILVTDRHWAPLNQFNAWDKIYVKIPLFLYQRISSDNCKVYSYIIQKGCNLEALKNQAAQALNVQKNTVSITDTQWKPYSNNKSFTVWEKIFVKVK